MRELIDAGAGGYALVIIGLAAGAIISILPAAEGTDKFLYLCSTTMTIGGTILKPAEKAGKKSKDDA